MSRLQNTKSIESNSFDEEEDSLSTNLKDYNSKKDQEE